METVIAIQGEVIARPVSMINHDLNTGEIEIMVQDLQVLNESRPVPLTVKDTCDAMDETRLKYRYLDLRRPSMQKNMLLRHRTAQCVRQFFTDQQFVEIETPFLMKSTPEGARDYLVPSRIHKGKFYALPQSPQLYKQILMVAGYDRYFQIVKCFRDEDLRADRQPEFTQIDVEMSFVEEDEVIHIMEQLMAYIFKEIRDISLETPFPRFTYSEIMTKYGSDRPDLRFDLQITDITDSAGKTDFRVFKETAADGGKIRGICLKGQGRLSRKQVDTLTDQVKDFGARGLVVIQVTEEGICSPIAKFLSESDIQDITQAFNAGIHDNIFIVADQENVCCDALSFLRHYLAKHYQLYDADRFVPFWVTDFPLLEWDPDEDRYVAMHHPFTSPKPEDVPLMDTHPDKIRARSYDLVVNGSEIAGGSIRIHQSGLQSRVLELLGIDADKAKRKFGFLIEALDYGAPPHGGIAFGFDRLVMMLANEESIREVIAFPKTTSAISLMDGCPSEVSSHQLKELGIKLNDNNQ